MSQIQITSWNLFSKLRFGPTMEGYSLRCTALPTNPVVALTVASALHLLQHHGGLPGVVRPGTLLRLGL